MLHGLACWIWRHLSEEVVLILLVLVLVLVLVKRDLLRARLIVRLGLRLGLRMVLVSMLQKAMVVWLLLKQGLVGHKVHRSV